MQNDAGLFSGYAKINKFIMKGMILVSEELIQRNLIENPDKIGDWNYYNIGSTTVKALKNAKIIPDRDYGKVELRKPDALITSKNVVIALIEYKQPSQLRTKKQIEAAISQELDTARALQAKIYIVTDGSTTFWINPITGNKVLNEDGSEVSVKFNKDNKDCIILINKMLASLSSENDKLKEISSVDPLPLAQKVWQDLWAVSGATPENCLYTFVELFIFKYLSDLQILSGMFSFYDLLKRYSVNSESEVLEFYASSVRRKIKEFFPGNPIDKTTIINGTIFVSKDDKAVAGYATVFRKILKRFSDFGSLENIDYDFKSRLFETFLKESISRKNWGQYFTPLKVVRAIVNMADITTGMKICDPACGVGKFLLEPILRKLHSFYIIDGNELKPQIHLYGFDKGFDREEQKTIILAKANMLIYMSDMIREHLGMDMEPKFAALFNETFSLQTNSILGTLAKPIRNEYDLILTNPPYVMSGSSNLKEEIDKSQELKEYFTVNAMGIEGLFMEWIINALKPGGKAFVIVPDGVMNRSNDKKLRSFILEQCIIDAVISLPLNTFFTTNKKTYILALTKKSPVHINGIDTLTKQDTPIFTYLCSEIGETRDTYRFDIEQNDLKTASELFNMFKGAKNIFRTEDRRCKVVSIDSFYESNHWCVDRWWTHEELIALGVRDDAKTVSVDGLINFIDDIANTLTELNDELREAKKKIHNTTLKTKEFPLSEIFDVKRGSGKYTKSYVYAHKGKYPLYSGNTKGKFADIDSYDYAGHCLTWVIDGLAGYIMVHEEPFSATNHRGVLLPKTDSIDLQYAKYILEPLFRNLKKGREGIDGSNEYTSLPPFMLDDVMLELPVNEDGKPDLSLQQEISGIYILIDQIKQYAAEKIAAVERCNVNLDTENEDKMTKNFALTSLFTMKRGSSKYTKKYCSTHAGNYPLYSASTGSPLGYIDTYDYDGRYITWSTDGFAGNILIIDGKFSVNSARGILLPLEDRADIDYDYVKFILEPVLRKAAKGRRDIDGGDEYTHLPPAMLEDVMIPFPVKLDGTIDIDVQKEISAVYKTVQACQKRVVSQLDAIVSQQVVL